MKKNILKKIWFAIFALFLIGSSLEVNAQTNNSNQRIATNYDVVVYDQGTFQEEGAIQTLNAERINLKGSNSGNAEVYRYYTSVIADVKRNDTSLEDALLNNLPGVNQASGMTNLAIKELYNSTVNILQ